LTTGEVAAHIEEVYGTQGVQGHHQPDHRDQVIDDIAEWQHRPLDRGSTR
jgi:transposase-like protein